MQWRVIEIETHSASMNMALDEACMFFMEKGEVLPTIRFYRWNPSAVSLGYFQNLNDEVDKARCDELNVQIVRRITGGGAVYHDFDGEITYSLIAPQSCFNPSIQDSYKEICSSVVRALELLGIKSSFKPINDVMVGEKKISGSAQTRKNGILLQHGTVLYKTDIEKMFDLLRVNQVKLDAKAIKSVYKLVTSVSEFVDVGIDGLYEVLFDAFVENKVWSLESWTEKEILHAKNIAKEKYSSNEHMMIR